MALTLEGATLTEAHRVGQVSLQAETVKDLAAVWPLLDPSNLDGSFEGYAQAALAVLNLRREQSAGLALGYYSLFRELEGITEPLTDLPALARLAEEQALVSLFVTGPVEAKKTMARSRPTVTDGATLAPESLSLSTRTTQAMERAFVTSAGAAMRLTADAGREVLTESIRRDSTAIGYARVTDGSPCAFCAMLASRGVAFKSGSFGASNARFTGGTGRAKVHDHCGCSVEPVFGSGDDYTLPGRAQEFADLWKESGANHSGDDAVNAFRRAYERPHLHGGTASSGAGTSSARRPVKKRETVDTSARPREKRLATLAALERSLDRFDSPATRQRISELSAELGL